MTLIEQPGRRLLVPMRAQAGTLKADALIEIGPEHPDYDRWLRYFEAHPEVEMRYREEQIGG